MIMPSKIINAIEPIRQIRNLFAHNLEINSFIEAKKWVLEKKKKNPFPMLNNKIRTIINRYHFSYSHLFQTYGSSSIIYLEKR
jgi:hypothetical protein